jgi:hypothetical protein
VEGILAPGPTWPKFSSEDFIGRRSLTMLLKSTCEARKKFSPHSRALSQPSQLITHSWLLQKWGIDIVGPLPTAEGNYKYMVVAVEYFTKWIEVKPLLNIASASLKKFF